MKLVDDKKIYPNETTPVLEHYKGYFDTVKICFLPFFQLNYKSDLSSRKGSKQISLEELKEKDELFKNISAFNAEIYESNIDYPKETEIINSGKIVNWNEVISKTTLENFREVNRALKTTIGAYKIPLRRFDLVNKLEKFTEVNQVWSPTEGNFDVFTKLNIYRLLNKLDIDEIIVIDQFYEETKELNIKNLSDTEFVDTVKYNDYYIYSKDESILFAISWDDFFFLLVTKKGHLKAIDEMTEIEGFIAKDTDSHLWDWEEGEIENILNASSKPKKETWWQKLINKRN